MILTSAEHVTILQDIKNNSPNKNAVFIRQIPIFNTCYIHVTGIWQGQGHFTREQNRCACTRARHAYISNVWSQCIHVCVPTLCVYCVYIGYACKGNVYTSNALMPGDKLVLYMHASFGELCKHSSLTKMFNGKWMVIPMVNGIWMIFDISMVDCILNGISMVDCILNGILMGMWKV